MPSSYVIGDHFEKFIRAQIEAGRYASASEVIRDSLRLLENRERLRQIEIEEYREKVKEGMTSGQGIAADAVFDRLEAKYQTMLGNQV
jgi:antitoxin ParD1/3/4